MFENVDIGNYVPIFIDGHSHVGELPRVLLEWGFNYDSWLYYGLCEDEKQKEWSRKLSGGSFSAIIFSDFFKIYLNKQ